MRPNADNPLVWLAAAIVIVCVIGWAITVAVWRVARNLTLVGWAYMQETETYRRYTRQGEHR